MTEREVAFKEPCCSAHKVSTAVQRVSGWLMLNSTLLPQFLTEQEKKMISGVW